MTTEAAMQQPLLSNGFANKHVCTAKIRTVFCVLSVPRYYKQDSWSNELVVTQPPAGKKLSTEAEDIVGIRN
jgi:hypothetical protein